MYIKKSQILLLVGLLFSVGLLVSSFNKKETVVLKYGGNADISKSECVDTSRSSFITSACYDDDTRKLVLGLSEINYAYCGLPKNEWEGFKEATSLGKYYDANIKDNYKCN